MDNIGFLFDLDGVLIDSESEYTRIWSEIDTAFPSGKADFPHLIKGQTLHKILSDNYPEEIRKDVERLLHDLEGKMHYVYCPYAEEFLDQLNAEGERIAVVTSSDSVKMSHLFHDIPGFKDKVSVIVDAGMVVKSKPDPEGYITGASLLDCDIRKCVVFEDSVQGVTAGKASGAFVVGIAGTKSPEELAPFSDIIVHSLAEIDLPWLKDTVRKR